MLAEYVPTQVKDDIAGRKADVYLSMARGEARNQRYPSAVDYLTRVINAQPLDIRAHLNMAWALRKMGGRRDDAEQEIKVACALGIQEDHLLQFFNNDDIETAYIRARIFQLGGDTKDARALYTSILASDPGHADAQAALAEMKKR
jgi:tetratricopeptide (TPR) repeat protein